MSTRDVRSVAYAGSVAYALPAVFAPTGSGIIQMSKLRMQQMEIQGAVTGITPKIISSTQRQPAAMPASTRDVPGLRLIQPRK